MTSRHPDQEHILREIRAAEIDFRDGGSREGVRRIATELSNLRFGTTSDCGMVESTHNGASALVDIRISEFAFDYYDSRQLASVIERTVKNGELAVREMLRKVVRDGRRDAAH